MLAAIKDREVRRKLSQFVRSRWFKPPLSGSRMAYRYFRYTRTRHHARSPESNPTLVLGRAADAEVLLRGIESGAVKKIQAIGILSPSRADRSQSIRGIPVMKYQYAGGSFEWLRPLPMLCGIGLVLGYALLGAGWLILKN